MIFLKRAYQPPQKTDGQRILIDRLWPRGVKKSDLKLDGWQKDFAPSPNLRKWFDHDPKKWQEFRKRYKEELKKIKPELKNFKKNSKRITLVYGAKDPAHNHAIVLKEVLDKLV